jgi:Ala-tRNA(Pro) deacylase
MDEDLCKLERIGVHPNDNTASVYLSPDNLLNIIREHGNPVEILYFK